MFVAELKGKIPSELQNYEDILTSSTIGVFQYLSSPSYIQAVLESSINIGHENLKFAGEIEESDYIFWPKLEASEPDVLLYLKTVDGTEYLICIEAKFWSDKSSSEDLSIEFQDRGNGQRDQLAREIEDLHKNICFHLFNLNKKKIKKPILLYLTNHTYFPSTKILESLNHVKVPCFPKENIYWLPWREIHKIINKTTKFHTSQDILILTDLKKILEKKGLKGFNGYQQEIVPVKVLNYDYSTSSEFIEWDIKQVNNICWKYGGTKNG
ncbi:hypothetical protein [Mesobacillus jeotgali]|uniref:hypothetical protein n=1 Tax=Mesobacillus jeotgali TaxID=129985 RepID=UPI0009A680F3|nr:hypothetical protein [Mesobacillus jeotgali]